AGRALLRSPLNDPASSIARSGRRPRSALTTVVLVRIMLGAVERVVPERLPVDRDEHDGARPRRPIHPDCGRHGSRAGVDALPHAAGGPEIPPARRRLALAFFEAITRECIHNVLRLGAPPALRFALSANMSETVTPWKFSVEGEAGLESDERMG